MRLRFIGGSLLAYSTTKIIACDNTLENHNPKHIAVVLTAKSRENLKNHLRKVGMTGCDGTIVILKDRVNDKDIYLYEPLFGERVAFRLKGIIKTKKGIVGTGVLSTVSGPLFDDEYTPSIVLLNDKELSDSSKNDLPSRLSKAGIIPNRDLWRGRLPGLTLQEPAVSLSYSVLPWKNQIVLEGHLCPNTSINKHGQCVFERKSIMPPPPSAATSNSKVVEETKQGGGESTADSNQEYECPVCKYMKGGPCKEEFLLWDECVTTLQADEPIQKCYPQTAGMMKCMRQHEYYDIMTVGSVETPQEDSNNS